MCMNYLICVELILMCMNYLNNFWLIIMCMNYLICVELIIMCMNYLINFWLIIMSMNYMAAVCIYYIYQDWTKGLKQCGLSVIIQGQIERTCLQALAVFTFSQKYNLTSDNFSNKSIMPKIWEIQVHLLSQSIEGFYQMSTQIALCHPVKYPGINGFNGCMKIFISKTTHA